MERLIRIMNFWDYLDACSGDREPDPDAEVDLTPPDRELLVTFG